MQSLGALPVVRGGFVADLRLVGNVQALDVSAKMGYALAAGHGKVKGLSVTSGRWKTPVHSEVELERLSDRCPMQGARVLDCTASTSARRLLEPL